MAYEQAHWLLNGLWNTPKDVLGTEQFLSFVAG
jgi:hypothetical protein